MSGVDPHQKLIAARERATIARLRLINSVQSTQRRLSFGRLKDDALVAASDKVDEIRNDLRQTVRKHPIAIASATVGVLTALFWRPARIATLYGLRGAQIVWLNRRLWRRFND